MNGKLQMLVNRVIDRLMDGISIALNVIDRRNKFDQINSVQIYLFARHRSLLEKHHPELLEEFDLIVRVEELEDGEQDGLFKSVDLIAKILAEANERAETVKGLEGSCVS